MSTIKKKIKNTFLLNFLNLPLVSSVQTKQSQIFISLREQYMYVFLIVVIQIPDKPFPKENVTGSKGNIVDKVNKLSDRSRE